MRFRKVARQEFPANVRGRVPIFRGRDALFQHPVILSLFHLSVILRSEATKDLLFLKCERPRSFASLRMTGREEQILRFAQDDKGRGPGSDSLGNRVSPELTMTRETTGCRLRPRLRVLRGQEIVLGPGKADLLDAIARTGELRRAAGELNMSYMRAWKLVQ